MKAELTVLQWLAEKQIHLEVCTSSANVRSIFYFWNRVVLAIEWWMNYEVIECVFCGVHALRTRIPPNVSDRFLLETVYERGHATA